MKKNHLFFTRFLPVTLLFFFSLTDAQAVSPILRTFQSVRAAAMGNIRYTTGVFEENFFANPARITDNPENLFQLPKFTFEAGSGTLSSLSNLFKSGGGVSNVSSTVGKPVSARFQLMFPAYYNREFIEPEWSFGVGVLTSAQMVGQVSQSGTISPTTVVGFSPVLTVARKFLPEDRLSVGLNAHFDFRASSGSPFSIVDILKGEISSSLQGGSGLGLDFDLGSTFKPHWGLGGFNYQLAFAINNLLGGKYNNLGGRISGWPKNPLPSSTSFNFGVAARRSDVWEFSSLVIALEFTDIGNNPNGSLFRTLHFGSEAQWKALAARFGINQGYLCGGLGVDAGFFVMNLSTYGEELGLNAGSLEDRRYALDFGFQI